MYHNVSKYLPKKTNTEPEKRQFQKDISSSKPTILQVEAISFMKGVSYTLVYLSLFQHHVPHRETTRCILDIGQRPSP